ncbi:MAG TPA: hypothetical protein VK971_08645 [Thiohalobacter sp.]|nr:hypothetical protein [Thiohalobacter sp.]
MARHVIVQSGAPAAAPDYRGQHYIDDAEPAHYLAVGTSSVSDWLKVGSGGGINPQTIYDNGTISDPLNLDVAHGFAQKATVVLVTSLTINVADPPDVSKMWTLRLFIANSGSPLSMIWAGVAMTHDQNDAMLLQNNNGNLMCDLVWTNGMWTINLLWTDGSGS